MKGLLAAIFPLVLCSAFCEGQEWGRLLSADSPIRNATLQFYTPDSRATFSIRVQRIHTDYERRGFLKIGVLPLKVLAGTTVTIQDSLTASNTLAELHHWLGPSAARRVELRDVRLLGRFSPWLRTVEAGRGRFLSDGTLELSRGVRYVSGTNEVRGSRGRLKVTGPDCGELTIDGAAGRPLSFFGSDELTPAEKWNPTYERTQSQNQNSWLTFGRDDVDPILVRADGRRLR